MGVGGLTAAYRTVKGAGCLLFRKGIRPFAYGAGAQGMVMTALSPGEIRRSRASSDNCVT